MYNSQKRTQPISFKLGEIEYPVPSIENAIYTLRPGADWEYVNGLFSYYEDPEGRSKPTNDEINNEVERMENIFAFYEYSRKRKDEYAPITEQLDMLYKDIQSGLFGNSAMDGSWYKHIKSIKEKYVKETGLAENFVRVKKYSDGSLIE